MEICPVVEVAHVCWLTGSFKSLIALVPQSSLLQRDQFPPSFFIDNRIIVNRKFEKAKAIQPFYGVF